MRAVSVSIAIPVCSDIGNLIESDDLSTAADPELLQPVIEAANAGANAHLRLPTCRVGKLACIRDIILLVCRSPFSKTRLRPPSLQFLDQLEQLQQADGLRGSASNVERLAGNSIDVLHRQ